MDLENILKSQNPVLFSCLQDIKKFCSEEWDDKLLPWFTNHDCGRKVRGELLTALLMIADELDLQCKRIDFSDTAKFDLSSYSQVHWFKHHYVDYVDVEKAAVNVTLKFLKMQMNIAN
jgi:hypothetical protein